jgi:hypothetical protein
MHRLLNSGGKENRSKMEEPPLLIYLLFHKIGKFFAKI